MYSFKPSQCIRVIRSWTVRVTWTGEGLHYSAEGWHSVSLLGCLLIMLVCKPFKVSASLSALIWHEILYNIRTVYLSNKKIWSFSYWMLRPTFVSSEVVLLQLYTLAFWFWFILITSITVQPFSNTQWECRIDSIKAVRCQVKGVYDFWFLYLNVIQMILLYSMKHIH